VDVDTNEETLVGTGVRTDTEVGVSEGAALQPTTESSNKAVNDVETCLRGVTFPPENWQNNRGWQPMLYMTRLFSLKHSAYHIKRCFVILEIHDFAQNVKFNSRCG
jgi:hypothetical protein